MPRGLAAALAVLTALLLFVHNAHQARACSCAALTPAQEAAAADAVFTGRVSGIARPTTRLSGTDPVDFTFSVTTVYKGSVPAQAHVLTVASKASCGYSFAVGRVYTVFAAGQAGSPLTTGLCSGDLAGSINPAGYGLGAGTGLVRQSAGPATPIFPSWLWLPLFAAVLGGGAAIVRWRRRRSP